MLLLVLFMSLVASLPLSGKSYSGDKVLSFNVTSTDQLSQLGQIIKSNPNFGLDLWTDLYIGQVHILVPLASQTQFAALSKDIPSFVLIEDVQAEINRERAHSAAVKTQFPQAYASGIHTANTFFADYQPLTTIVSYFTALPGVTKVSIGKTYGGQDIPGFKFGTGSRAIAVTSGLHAREWIAPAVLTYIANYLTGGTPDAKALLGNFTFTFIPVVNVDGYGYTSDPSGDRLWRKNRQSLSSSSCMGVDINRNFDYGWGYGASTNPCDDTFQGVTAFDAPETKAIADYIVGLKAFSYIDFHSYSQLFMYPYGWTCANNAPDRVVLQKGGQLAVNAIQATSGTQYALGDICNTVYQAGGSSTDYFYNKGVKFSYAVELRDTGSYGFTLPASEIVPTGLETLNGVLALWNFVATQ